MRERVGGQGQTVATVRWGLPRLRSGVVVLVQGVPVTRARAWRAAVDFVPWRKLPACEFAGNGKLEACHTGKFSSAARLETDPDAEYPTF